MKREEEKEEEKRVSFTLQYYNAYMLVGIKWILFDDGEQLRHLVFVFSSLQLSIIFSRHFLEVLLSPSIL